MKVMQFYESIQSRKRAKKSNNNDEIFQIDRNIYNKLYHQSNNKKPNK